jgi:AcrR family transcriptional regulator
MPDAVLPRPRNADDSRARIMAAAQQLFATRGYVATGVRDVARLAEVNSALVGRYFGTKLQLFEAALAAMLVTDALFVGDRSDFGRRSVHALLSPMGSLPLAMMMFANADPQARDLSIALLQDRIVAPLVRWLGGDDAELRAARINLIWSGFLNCAQLLPLPIFAADRLAPTLDWMAGQIQAIVDG